MPVDSVPEFPDVRGLFPVDPALDRRGSADPASLTWRKNLDFLRLKDAALYLLDLRQGVTVLDLGCANGAQMIYCALQGATVHGIDLDAERVATTQAKLTRLGLRGHPRVGNAMRLPYPDQMFDAVLSSDFHEHLTADQQFAALSEARRVLNPGGRLVLKTPNLSYLRLALWFKRLSALARGRSPFGYVIPHTPGTRNPEHVGLTTHARLGAQLLEAGFLNWAWQYPPLRRFGYWPLMEMASSEIPGVRDWLCEDLIVLAYAPIASAHFPD